jgi:hypothetical protein
MQPVIKFNKKSPQIDHSFFRRGDSCPIIISIIGGIHSGKTHLINSLLSLSWQHSHRRYQHEVFGAVRSSPGADLVALEWQLELHPHSLKDDARVVQTAVKISDIIIVMPFADIMPIDYAAFICHFLEPSDPLFVFSPCSDIELINDRAKVALSKRRVFALPLSTCPEFSKKLLEIKEIVYSEIDRRPKRSREEYHQMLDQMALIQGDYDFSYDIDGLLEAQCWMTLKDLAKLIFVQNIKPKLPMEEDELTTKIEQCLEGLRACGRKLILRPTTTFAQDIARELKSRFKEWKTENYEKSRDTCQSALLEFLNQRATNPALLTSSVKLVGPAKKEFATKLADLEVAKPPKKRKLDASPDGNAKRPKLSTAGPLKKFILYNNAGLGTSSLEIQRISRELTPAKLFKNRFFKTALGETPLYRVTHDNYKIVVRIPANKSFVEFVDAYRIDMDSGEKIQLDQATRNKIDSALAAAKRRNIVPTTAVQEVVNAAFGGKSKSTNGKQLLSSMAIEDDITFMYPMIEVLVDNKSCMFNKFTVKGKTRLNIIKHIIAFFKVMNDASDEKKQEIFDSFRVSCNFGNAEMKNEFFEMFYDPMDHTTVEIREEDPTDEEVIPMDVREDKKVVTDLPVDDVMAEDESLFTTGSFEEDEAQSPPSSQFTLADNVIVLDDD